MQLVARVHPDDASRPEGHWQAALADPTVNEWRGEFRVRAPQPAPDGTPAWRWMRVVASFERDARGAVLRGVGTMVEFTAERELQREQAARAAAEARSEAARGFLSRMSHELRTPLNAVIGYAQLLRTEAPGSDVRLQRIERAGWHLLSLIDDILDLSRLEAGALRVQPAAVPLLPMFGEVGDLVEPLLRKHRVTLDVESTDLCVRADPTRLRQVLLNLVSNGAKYNRPGGEVRLSARRAGERVEIRVADNGLGMTDEQQQRLFKPFERLGREQSGIDGTGLGLAITDALLRLMDGGLQLASTAGSGTVFWIDLPLAADAEAAVAALTQPMLLMSEPAPQPRRVLCVEDNEVNALMFTEALRHLRPQWSCEVAVSLEQARQALARTRFDHIFIDLHLPDGDGDGLALIGPRRGEAAPARTVLLSADASDQAQRSAQRRGVMHRLGKPFRLAELDGLLAQLEQAEQPSFADTGR
jgi:signal transduction histidine kinase/ActR/RegA family two-component response regulator